jgi:hypothetical protein
MRAQKQQGKPESFIRQLKAIPKIHQQELTLKQRLTRPFYCLTNILSNTWSVNENENGTLQLGPALPAREW